MRTLVLREGLPVYAGVGSRRGVPISVVERAARIATELRDAGWILRTGGAIGMDAAWLAGAGEDRAEVYRPEHCSREAYELASRLHPAWERLSDRTRLLHGRNMMIVLGPHLVTPVQRVLCWTPGGQRIGGTAMAIRCAEVHGIPVTNLGSPQELRECQPTLL